ncbi:secreted RxLR effector protein 161-like [Elaeis guineensis]|uniref:secreted RxLR effector protein 161-like n=1 Tax=Elaeis guineensis var. tenera TaxID=51953 RepID=UPI003C6D2F28
MEELKLMHWKAAKRILRYIRGTITDGLFYSHHSNLELVGYSNSDWAGDMDDRNSTFGFIFSMGDVVFSWMSKKQPIVTLSTCEAEYVAASACISHAIWLRSLLKEVHFEQKEPTKISIDSKSAIALGKNPVYHQRSKHIDVCFHSIREHVKNKEVELLTLAEKDICVHTALSSKG